MGLMTTKIIEALNVNPHVTLYTQDIGTVMKLLNEEPGRWTVGVNTAWWFDLTKLPPNNKWRVVKENPEIGLDCEGSRLTISKNPFRVMTKKSFVIKDFFIFPEIQEVDIYPPTTFIAKHKGKLAIISSDRRAFHELHDQLVMNETPHVLDEEGPLSIFSSTRYIHDYDAVAIYKQPIVPLLMPLHDCGKVVVIGNRTAIPKMENCEVVMRCLSQTPTSGQTFEFMAYQTLLHPRTLRDTLSFLCLVGSVKEVYPDSDVVIIEKRGKAPDDMLFHAIPEGTWFVRKLVSHLKIERGELFPLLKSFEGKGLVFSYAPSPHRILWTVKDELNEQKFRKTMDILAKNEAWLHEMRVNPTIFLNRYLEKEVQLHAKRHAIRASFFKDDALEEIDPTGRTMAINLSY